MFAQHFIIAVPVCASTERGGYNDICSTRIRPRRLTLANLIVC